MAGACGRVAYVLLWRQFGSLLSMHIGSVFSHACRPPALAVSCSSEVRYPHWQLGMYEYIVVESMKLFSTRLLLIVSTKIHIFLLKLIELVSSISNCDLLILCGCYLA